MNEFDKLDLMVVPIQDPIKFEKRPNYNGQYIKWGDPKTWCSWQEREDIYPSCSDWYVIPANKCTYIADGIEVGYWILDIDKHDGDRFEEAIAFLRECNLPPTLTIRTPSGGLHLYYFAPVDDLPAPVAHDNATGLPIEVKVHTGVVAPNGRDRKIIVDKPVAYLTVVEGNKLAELTRLKSKNVKKTLKPINPNYQLPEPTPLLEGSRHDTLLKEVRYHQDMGCPADKALEWLKARRAISPGSRPMPDNELEDMIAWPGSGQPISSDIEELKQEAEQESDPLAGAIPLTGWESIYAQVLFSTKEEAYNLIAEELEKHPGDTPAETKFLADMFSADLSTMKRLWAANPPFQQKYLWYKDCMKEVQAK